jgi:hypothetical protein
MTPREWLDKLNRALDYRWYEGIGSHPPLQACDAYYEGDQTLAYMTRKFREAYGSMFADLTDNWMPTVIESSVERLRVQGFRFGDDRQADKDAWKLWQANGLDADANMVHTEAAKLGWAYWMVAPQGENEVPRITGDHPRQVIVQTAPGNRRDRLAALKRWTEGDEIYANVYLPDRVVHYRTTKRLLQDVIAERRWETIGAEYNPLGEVPIIPVPNNPSMLSGGRSDLAGGPMAMQDAINKLFADMLIGSEYQAYPQRVLLGVDQPRNEKGDPIPNAELRASQSRLWMFPNENARAHEFSAADLSNFWDAIQGLVDHLAAQTRTPPHYVVGKMANMSGDALKAAETGLVSKVRDKMDPYGEAHEDMIRLAFKAQDADDERANEVMAETIWVDPESRTEGESVDAAVKLKAINVPDEILWERIGASPQEIDRWRQLAEAERLLKQAVAPQPNPNEAVVNTRPTEPEPTNGAAPGEPAAR